MYAYVRTKRTTVTWMTRTKGGIFSAYVNRHRRLYEKSHTYTLANHPRMAQKKERNEFWRNDQIENERTNSRSLAGLLESLLPRQHIQTVYAPYALITISLTHALGFSFSLSHTRWPSHSGVTESGPRAMLAEGYCWEKLSSIVR